MFIGFKTTVYSFIKILLLTLLFCNSLIVHSVNDNPFSSPVFKQFKESEKQSHLGISDIIEDDAGFIWFGAIGGLNRYDGYEFKSYPVGKDNRSITHANVNAITKDKHGNIWVGTYKGLNRFDQKTETFKHYFFEKNNDNSINSNFIRSFHLDSHGTLWIGTSRGLNRYNPVEDNFERIVLSQNNVPLSIANIKEDQSGLLWMVTHNSGLISYDKNKGAVNTVKIDLPHHSVSANFINSFSVDSKNRMWIVTQAGLVEYDINNQKFKLHLLNQEVYEMNDILIDSDNNFWIGVNSKGVCNFKLINYSWHCFKPELNQTKMKEVVVIYKDSNGIIWLGTNGTGMVYFKPEHPFEIIRFEHSHRFIQNIEQDKNNDLWFGTNNGVVKLAQNRETQIYQHQKNDLTGLDSNNIFSLTKDSSQRLWIASDDGLNYYDYEQDRIINVKVQLKEQKRSDYGFFYAYRNELGDLYLPSSKHDFMVKLQADLTKSEKVLFANETPKGLLSRGQFCAFLDTKNRLWVCGLEYIAYLNEKSNKLHTTDFTDNTGRVYIGITEDFQGNLWIIDYYGLHKLNAQGKVIKSLDGSLFKGSILFSIASNRQDKNLWIGSNQGIWQFNIETESVAQYTINDGVQDNEFNPATHVDKNGYIYMGGVKGTTVFHPDTLSSATRFKPRVQLTSLLINNIPQPVKQTKDSILTRSLNFQKEIVLNSQQSQLFSLEFSSLDYFSAESSQFAYKLEGYNDAWIYTDAANRRAVYTSLPAGEYTFHVKAANVRGVWNHEATQIKIKIIAPWWLTSWAYTAYAGLFLLIVTLFIRYRIHAANRRADRLEEQVELRTRLIQEQRDQLQDKNSQLEQVNEAKNRFFTNISHEFRTPLSLAIGPLREVILHNNIPEQQDKEYIKTALKNNLHMMDLLGQVLDINRLEAGGMPINISKINLVTSLQYCIERFKLQAEKQSILFKTKGLEDKGTINADVFFDAEHFEKIMLNLLSNAVKYSPTGGFIEVGLEIKNTAKIWVKDQGPGISSSDQKHIFDRYYQGKFSSYTSQPGTGIGLALVKELLNLHHGNITVESLPGAGACFTIFLKTDLEHYHLNTEYDYLLSAETNSHFTDLNEPLFDELPALDGSSAKSLDTTINHRKTLLIIDDNAELRAFIKSTLKNIYNVVEADNGREGLQAVIDYLPDVIVSDVMMPVMDGFQLAQKLKASVETSHIPLILLTAKSAKSNVVEGLQHGADDYLSKPFDSAELAARIAAQIAQKQRQANALFNQFQQQDSKPQETLVVEFPQQVLDTINEHLNESDFDVTKLCQYLHVHQATLNRRVKKVFECTPVQLLRKQRLLAGLEMLRSSEGTISEVAYACGFESLAYFSRCFSQEFQHPPSEYLKINASIATR